MSYKWHYFNAVDELCVLKDPFKERIWLWQTYCGRLPGKVKRHTEFKDRVTCIQCLRKINLLGGDIEDDKV